MADKIYKRKLKIYIDGKEVEASVGLINKQLRKLKGEMKNLTIGTDEYNKKAAEIRQLNAILDEHRKNLRGVQEEVKTTGGFFENLSKAITTKFTGAGEGLLRNFDGILGGMKTSWLKFAGWIGAAVVSLKGAIDAGRWFVGYSEGIEEAQRLTKEFLNITGKDLTHVQSQISTVAKSLGKDYKEVLSTVDALMQHFGLSADEVVTAIEDGIQAGGDLNGTLLQQLNQFGPAARDAGNSIQELVAMIVQTRSGIFNESGMALIQTAENRIRTMSTATAHSLDAIGISSKQLEQDLISGQMTMFEAVQKVSKKIMELPQNASIVGQAMKDVFGKTASNEGMAMIAAIADMTTDMDVLKEVTGEYGEIQRQQVETEAELIEKFENFFNIGQTGYQELTGKAKLYITQSLVAAIDETRNLINWFIDLYNKSLIVRGGIQLIALAFKQTWTTAKTALFLIVDHFKELGRLLKGVATTFKGVFTLDFELAEKGIEKIFDFKPYAKDVFEDVGGRLQGLWDNMVGAWNNTLDGKLNYIDAPGHSSNVEQSGVTIIGHRTSGASNTNSGNSKGGTTGKSDKANTNVDAAKAAAEARKAVQDALAAVDLEYQQKLNNLKQQYIEGELKDREEYNKKVEECEIEALRKKMAIAGLEESQREQLMSKILDAQVKLQEKLLEAEKNAIKEAKEARDKDYQERLLSLRERGLKERRSTEKTNEDIREIQKNHLEEILNDVNATDEERNEARAALLDMEETEYQNTYNTISGYVQQFSNIMDATMEDVFEKGISGLKTFAKEVLKTVLDAIEKKMLAKYAEILMDSIAESGWAGVAAAAGKMALITAAFSAAKAAIGQWYEGGYTGKGKKKEPAGIVHKGEYVIPSEGVNNPQLQPVIEKIEIARKQGKLGNMAASDLVPLTIPNVDARDVTPSEGMNNPQLQSETEKIEIARNQGKPGNMAVSGLVPLTIPKIDVRNMARNAGSVAHLSKEDIESMYGSLYSVKANLNMDDIEVLKDVAGAVRELKENESVVFGEVTGAVRNLNKRLDRPITAQTHIVGKGGIEEAGTLLERMRKNASRK